MQFCIIWVFLLLVGGVTLTNGQFPTVCKENATLPDAVCCPVPPGYNLPCGGPGRGTCEEITSQHIDFSPLYPELSGDDRLDWPHRFFTYACQCQNNFMGYQCIECQFGFMAPKCLHRYHRLRRNILTYTSAELKSLVHVLDLSKRTLMKDYVILTNVYDVDPVTEPRFKSVTIYDFFVFMHAYTARQTILPPADGRRMQCDSSTPLYDFAHGGPAFPPWHRLYNLLLEREIQKMTGDANFALPYWKWVGGGGVCEVCTDDIMGSTNYSDPAGTLNSRSPFSKWNTICQNTSVTNGCRVCDVTQPGERVQRVPGNPDHPTLPSEQDLAFTMSRPAYDVYPFDANAPPDSFRACLEGSASRNGTLAETGQIAMHAISHQFFLGHEASVPNSPNDPLFLLQHCYVDRLYEEWLRKMRPLPTEIPMSGAPAGHCRNSPIVPVFPVHLIGSYMRDSREFGYDYDDLQVKVEVKSDDTLVPWLVALSLAALVLTLATTLVVVLCRHRTTRVEPPGEDTVLLNFKH